MRKDLALTNFFYWVGLEYKRSAIHYLWIFRSKN